MGHIVVMDDSPAQLALTHYARGLWSELESVLPAAADYEQRGTLWVASDDEELEEASRKQQTLAGRGVEAELLDSRAVTAEEPNLRAGLAGGLLVPKDAVVYPPAAAAFLLEDAGRAGAAVLRGHPVTAIRKQQLLLENGQTLNAAHIIVATGTATALLPGIQLEPRKGHLLITERYAGFARHQIVELGYLKSAHSLQEDSVAFNLQPRRNGQLLIGSSRQYGRTEQAIDKVIFAHMIDRACKYMPRLAHLSAIRAWTGFRAATPDKLPLIGPWEDLLIAVGFEGLGITQSLGAARLLVAHLLQRRPELDPTPYLPERALTREVLHA